MEILSPLLILCGKVLNPITPYVEFGINSTLKTVVEPTLIPLTFFPTIEVTSAVALMPPDVLLSKINLSLTLYPSPPDVTLTPSTEPVKVLVTVEV